MDGRGAQRRGDGGQATTGRPTRARGKGGRRRSRAHSGDCGCWRSGARGRRSTTRRRQTQADAVAEAEDADGAREDGDLDSELLAELLAGVDGERHRNPLERRSPIHGAEKGEKSRG